MINGGLRVKSNKSIILPNIKKYKLGSLIKGKSLFFRKHKVNDRQLSIIAGNLAQIYKSGIPIITALELIEDILEKKEYKKSILEIITLIQQGNSLSEGFRQYRNIYPEFFVGIISIGENTGDLHSVLESLNIYYMRIISIKKKIKDAVTYPIFILISLMILSVFLINTIVPNFFEIYKSLNIPLPAPCKFLYDIRIDLYKNPVITLIRIVSWIVILFIIYKTILNKLNCECFIKIQIVKAFYEYILVLLLSIVLSTGINISNGLKLCESSISFVYLKKKIIRIDNYIQNGKTLTQALECSGLFSKYVLSFIKIREESGMIKEGLNDLREILENKLNEQIKKYLQLLNPIFIFIMAVCIVVFLVVFVLPLFANLKNGMR